MRRQEDRELLIGSREFIADLAVDDALAVAFVRSDLAHGTIESIDVSAATQVPGVRAVLTASDLDVRASLPPFTESLVDDEFRRPPIATDKVRFVGEIVAMVVADSWPAALDAVDVVEVRITPLEMVVNADDATRADAPLLFPGRPSNVAIHNEFNVDAEPVSDGMRSLSFSTTNHRMAAAPMEGLAIVSIPGPGPSLTVHVSTQVPHWTRDHLAKELDLPTDAVRVVAPAVGGGFGSKTAWEVEYLLVAAAARLLDRTLRYIQTRSENLMTAHARGQRHDVTLAFDDDGVVHSLDVRAFCDCGAYPTVGALLPAMTQLMSVGVYRIPRVTWVRDSIVTNTAPTGAFRGAGRPEATAMIERALDLVAGDLGIDPIEARRRNLIPNDAFPYTTPTGATYDSGDYGTCLDLVAELGDYQGLRAEQRRRRLTDGTSHLGLGLSCYVEVTAGQGGTEFAEIRITAEGRLDVAVGTMSHGQGHATTYTQLVSSELDVPASMIRIVQGDTALVESGHGTQGSRSIQLGGSSVHDAAQRFWTKVSTLVAEQLETSPDDIVSFGESGVGVRGVPHSTLAWPEIHALSSGRDGTTSGLPTRGEVTQVGGSFPFGAHLAVAEVDEETGRVDLVGYYAVDDCGTIINPLLAEGQLHGGIVSGIAQALFESVEYDDNGTPLTTSFATYAKPSAADVPSIHLRSSVTPSPLNPLGAKGIGESGTVGATPAVQNAVIDAVAHLGVRHIDMPLSPETVWSAIRRARST
ncbi:MAG: xanthine dehydrogenase family protein molybdopterin-binding subunit [Ilumatobacteraceae bacterium]|nr:xanthine dehydrogenase family protein molybdopterin-binding subunit [Ilumatobacteraceae bacterium]